MQILVKSIKLWKPIPFIIIERWNIMSTMKIEKEKQQEQIKKAKNKYMKSWRAKNPDKAKANANHYWLKKAEELKNEAKIE